VHRSISAGGRIRSASLGIIAVIFVSMIVAYPDQAFKASLNGLTIWWDLVFPALLPFFILSEILLGLGFVHAMGVLLGPLMKLLFRLPGVGGWAIAMSLTAGFPSGAKAAADLRRDGAIRKEDGDKLLALSHLCSPIFITSVIAVGFLGRPELGVPLILIHIASAFITGLLIGYLPSRGNEEQRSSALTEPAQPDRKRKKAFSLLQAVAAMAEANRKDGRAFGRLLGDAVASAVQALLAIGGFIIVFSVTIELLSVAGIVDSLQSLIAKALQPLGMPTELAEGIIVSLFELHLGAYELSRSGSGMSVWAAALISGAVAWGGLSIHAQVKSLTSGTDLRFSPFFLARLIQSLVSMLLVFGFWNMLERWFGNLLPAFAGSAAMQGTAEGKWLAWPLWLSSMHWLTVLLCGSVLMSAVVAVFRRPRN